MTQQYRTYKNNIILLWISLFIAVLAIHIYLIAKNINTQNHIANDIIKNHHEHSFLKLLASAVNTLPASQLTILDDIQHYRFQIDKNNINISFSKQPKWPITLSGNINAHKINTAIQNEKGAVRLSYQMANGKWLNYKEQPMHSSYELMVILFLIELLFLSTLLYHSWSLYRLKIPLKSFKSSAERLGIDINADPIKEKGPLVVRDSANAMNKMQARIQELIKNRTLLLATISHDLKTPITRLKLRSQLLDDSETINKINRDLDEMQNMINGILSFASDDNLLEKKVKFDFISLIYTIIDEYEDMDYTIAFHSEVDTFPIQARKLAIKRSLNNIINNARKYANKTSLTIQQQGHQLVITIQDDGPGIPEDEISEICKAFYRSKSMRNHSSTGSGLGLTVTQEVVNDHNGKLSIENINPHGLSVTITLPPS